MHTVQSKNRNVLPLSRAVPHLLVFAAFGICASAQAVEAPNLRGQWIGNSQLEGSRQGGKTELSLGALDTDGTTLRIDDGRTCKLKQGSYVAKDDATWLLSFKEAVGGDSCERLSHGEFVLRTGGPRRLEFEVTYPAADGSKNHRSGVLSRYP